MLSIHKNFDLSKNNTLSVPSVCDFFCEVVTQEALLEAISFAKEKSINFYVLGEGSNILLPEHVEGLVVKISFKGISLREKPEVPDSIFVRAAAGENWHEFVCYCIKNNCYGLENLSLIPGSVGAAPIQNIGAYGIEIKDICSAVSVLDLETMNVIELSNSDCMFDYRESVFKTTRKQQYIVLAVEFCLSKEFSPVLEYPGLVGVLNKQDTHKAEFTKTRIEMKPKPNAHELAQAVISLRQSKLPDPKCIPNVGSFFKNPVIESTHYKRLLEKFPSMPCYSQKSKSAKTRYKIPAAWLIDTCGWKGKQYERVGVHNQQALVLINPQKQALVKILNLANLISSDVSKRFSIELELEPQLLSPKLI